MVWPRPPCVSSLFMPNEARYISLSVFPLLCLEFLSLSLPPMQMHKTFTPCNVPFVCSRVVPSFVFPLQKPDRDPHLSSPALCGHKHTDAFAEARQMGGCNTRLVERESEHGREFNPSFIFVV